MECRGIAPSSEPGQRDGLQHSVRLGSQTSVRAKTRRDARRRSWSFTERREERNKAVKKKKVPKSVFQEEEEVPCSGGWKCLKSFCRHAAVAWSDEGRPEALQAPLDAGRRRLIHPLQRLELLGAQLVVGHAVLPVEGLCGTKAASKTAQTRPHGATVRVTYRHRCSPSPTPPATGTGFLYRCS